MTPNEGEVQMLAAIVANETLVLGLYENDYTAIASSVMANLVPATFTGYAPVNLTAANWTINPGAPTTASYAKQSFTSSAPQSKAVYGYFIKGATSGKVYQSERFAGAPIPILNNGDKVDVTPFLTLGSTVSD